MFKLYSARTAENIIRRMDATIRRISARYAIPAAVLRAVLYQEITQIDLLDLFADWLVQFNWRRLSLRGALSAETLKKRGLLYKLDSSTGYAQVFARVGIEALNFGLDRGLVTAEELSLPPEKRLDAKEPRDLQLIWRRLHRERAFNLELAALNLLSAAQEKTGRIDFSSYSPEELQLILTRYNGTSREISHYGKSAYAHVLRYAEMEQAAV